MRVAEGEQTIAGDQGNHRIGTTATAMHARHGLENTVHIQLITVGRALQLMRQDVEQDFGIGIGIDVATIQPEHLALELLGVGQVAVVPENDTEGRVHVKRLRLGKVVGRTGCRIAHMADTPVTRERAHIAGAENVAHQPRALVQVKGIAFSRCNAQPRPGRDAEAPSGRRKATG
jgi:hypothetical protein